LTLSPEKDLSLRSRDRHAIAEIGRLRFSPLSVVGGEGSYLIEEGGRRVLDLSASAGPAALGYGHPAIVKAVTEAVTNMAGASLLLYPNEPAVALAERLLSTLSPDVQRKVWFGHSGSDANDCAVRVLQAATGRSRFISFIGSYHGNVSGSMAISGHTAMTHTLPRAGLVLLPYPDSFRKTFDADTILAMLEYQLRTTCPPDQVAAIFIEPILSDGGIIVPPPGFLKKLQSILRPHDIKIVVDEVKVGLGRSGLLHCFEHEGIVPDLVTFGKALGGGLPLSAVIGPAEIMDYAPAFALQTTAGNPVATAAGLAVLDTILNENLHTRSAQLGGDFLAQLRSLGERHEMIGDVRGRGLAVGIDLVADRQTRAPVPATTTAKIIYRAYELGAALTYVGLQANVLEFMPPLTISAEELAEGVNIIDRSITDVLAGKVSDDKVAEFMMW
jgi:4-aminobutyrate aminotransferase